MYLVFLLQERERFHIFLSLSHISYSLLSFPCFSFHGFKKILLNLFDCSKIYLHFNGLPFLLPPLLGTFSIFFFSKHLISLEQYQVKHTSFTSCPQWLKWLLCLENYLYIYFDRQQEHVLEKHQREGACPIYMKYTQNIMFRGLCNVLDKIFNKSFSDWFRLTTYLLFLSKCKWDLFLHHLLSGVGSCNGLYEMEFFLVLLVFRCGGSTNLLQGYGCEAAAHHVGGLGVFNPNNYCHMPRFLGNQDFLVC